MSSKLSVALIASLGCAASFAGPLDPPAGPVASTYKTLDEVEPRIPIGPDTTPGDASSLYKIVQPGSYYLTGRIQTDMEEAIEIGVARVTIDLNGYTIEYTGVDTTPSAITVNNVGKQVVIRNGSFFSWPGRAVQASDDVHCVLQDLSSRFGGGFAVGSRSIVERCTVEQDDGVEAFKVGDSSIVRDCIAFNSGSMSIATNGFDIGADSVVDGCVSKDNDGAGFILATRCEAMNCIATNNALYGFDLNVPSVSIQNCIVQLVENATTDGMIVGGACQIRSCNVKGGGDVLGIEIVGEGSTIEDSSIRNNFGIQITSTADHTVVRNCVVATGVPTVTHLFINGAEGVVVEDCNLEIGIIGANQSSYVSLINNTCGSVDIDDTTGWTLDGNKVSGSLTVGSLAADTVVIRNVAGSISDSGTNTIKATDNDLSNPWTNFTR